MHASVRAMNGDGNASTFPASEDGDQADVVAEVVALDALRASSASASGTEPDQMPTHEPVVDGTSSSLSSINSPAYADHQDAVNEMSDDDAGNTTIATKRKFRDVDPDTVLKRCLYSELTVGPRSVLSSHPQAKTAL